MEISQSYARYSQPAEVQSGSRMDWRDPESSELGCWSEPAVDQLRFPPHRVEIKKYPVKSSCVEEKDILISGVRGQTGWSPLKDSSRKSGNHRPNSTIVKAHLLHRSSSLHLNQQSEPGTSQVCRVKPHPSAVCKLLAAPSRCEATVPLWLFIIWSPVGFQYLLPFTVLVQLVKWPWWMFYSSAESEKQVGGGFLLSHTDRQTQDGLKSQSLPILRPSPASSPLTQAVLWSRREPVAFQPKPPPYPAWCFLSPVATSHDTQLFYLLQCVISISIHADTEVTNWIKGEYPKWNTFTTVPFSIMIFD